MVPSYCGNVIDAFRCFLYRDQTSLLHALKELGQLKNKREWRKIKLNQSKRDELLSTINSVKTVLSMTVNQITFLYEDFLMSTDLPSGLETQGLIKYIIALEQFYINAGLDDQTN